MDSYKTVKDEAKNSFIEKKSEFISHIRHTETEDEALTFIAEIKAMHRKATHNCYAYILRENNTARHSDDGEPQGTAGVPIYDTLKKEKLTDVACVITRYFGGIMLGAGGLVRAYGRGASDAVKAAQIQDFHMADKIELILPYNLYGKISRAFTDFDIRIAEENFGKDVIIVMYIKESLTDRCKSVLVDICSGNININNIQKEYYDFGNFYKN